jgi:hypothetical protein
MSTYKVNNLDSKTPQTDQAKLATAMKSVTGVESARVIADSSQIEIKGKGGKDPKRDELAAAASKAGFPLSGK